MPASFRSWPEYEDKAAALRDCFIVDELSLYREVGSPQVMAAQMRRLSAAAAAHRVTVQVLPAIAHPANASGFLMADDALWIEHLAGGYVYTDPETISALALRFDTFDASATGCQSPCG